MPEPDWLTSYLQALSQAYGVSVDFIRRRWQVLRALMPPEAQTRADVYLKWWEGLSTFDKVFTVGMVGQPLIRDAMRATSIVNNSTQAQAFFKNPDNVAWWYTNVGGIRPGTKEQEAFAKWYRAEWNRVMGGGVATAEYMKGSTWEQFRADLTSTIPYMLVSPLTAGRLVARFPTDWALEKVLWPGLRLVGKAVKAVSPGTVRFFMRTSEATVDLIQEQILNNLKKLQVSPEIREQILDKARPWLQKFRAQWLESSRQKAVISGDARQAAANLLRESRAQGKHLLVAEQVLAEKNNVWKEWQRVHTEIWDDINSLREQLKTAKGPAQVALTQQIQALNQKLLTTAGVYRTKLNAITVDAVVRGDRALGLSGMDLARYGGWSVADTQTVGRLYQNQKALLNSLYPPGKVGYNPFYFPEPNKAFEGDIARLRAAPAVTQWWEIERWMVGGSNTPEEALNKLVYRLSAPRTITVAEAQRSLLANMVTDLSANLSASTIEKLREGVFKAGVKLTDTQARNIIEGAMNPVLSFWRNSVLAGRLVPWTLVNAVGNATNSAIDVVVNNWMKGRWVSPWQFIKGMVNLKDTPLYVLESFGRQVGKEGGSSAFSRIMGKLYGVNAWVESAFRSGVYRMEYETVARDLAKRGVSKVDIPQLASRFGWDKVDQVLYNYGDKYWGARFLQPIAPFTTFKIENLRFWMKEIAENPWLLRSMIQTVEAHPEWNIKTQDLINFFEGRLNLPKDNAFVEALYYLRELGIDGRTIDLVSKANYFDILGQTGSWTKPAWLQDKEAMLSKQLAEILEKYKDNPYGLEGYFKQHPELRAYYDYAQQAVAWKVLDFSLGALGTNFLADEALQKLGIQRARNFHTIFPQQRLFGLIAGRLGKEWGIDLAARWAEPTPDQLTAEVRLLKLLGLSTGDPKKDAELAKNRWWTRNLIDQALDVGLMSGVLNSDKLKEFYDTVRRELGSGAGADFAPDPERASRIMVQYRIFDPVWVGILARREQMRDIETATPAQRRARQVEFDRLSDELKELIKTSGDPQVSGFWKAVDSAFQRWQRMDPVERRRFLQDNDSIEARLVRAVLGTRYTPAEREILGQVDSLGPKEREDWYLTAPSQTRSLFKEMFPREAAIYDAKEKGGPPPTFLNTAPPGTAVPGPALPHPARGPNDEPITQGVRPPSAGIVPPMATGPGTTGGPGTRPMPQGQPALQPTYSAEQVIRAISGVESGGNYAAISYAANRDKGGKPQGYALGKYQFLPQTITAMGYGKYLDSQNPADYMDKNRAKQLAARWLANPKIQDEAMAALVRANARGLGFGDGPYTREQVGYLALAHVGGVGLARRVMKDPSLANRITVGPNTSVTVAQYRANVQGNVSMIPPAGRTVGPGRAPQQAAPLTQGARVPPPQSPEEWYARRKVDVSQGGLLIDYPSGLISAMQAYILRINPDLDKDKAKRIAEVIYDLYDNPAAGIPGATRGFDPLWILAIIGEKTKFDLKLLEGKPGFDLRRNLKEVVEAFTTVQRQRGTRAAVEQFGVDYSKVYKRGSDIIGLWPVAVNPLERARTFALVSPLDTETDKAFAEFYLKLLWAGGDPSDPSFMVQRGKEWQALVKRATPQQLSLLKDHFPDLYYAVQEAAQGQAYWFRGKFVLEDGDPDYIAWKHKIFTAPSLEKAIEVYRNGAPKFQAFFAYNNGDMSQFFKDYLAGVARDYKNYEFSDSQDQEKYLPARRKLALALATGDIKKIKEAVKEIASIYGDDMPGFVRKLKEDTPALFEAAKPYLTADSPVYGPDERLKVRQFLAAINHNLETYRRTGDQQAIQTAAAMWLNPENMGLKQLVYEHETENFAEIERRLEGVPPIGHFISDEEYVPFQRWAQMLQTAYQSRSMEQMRQVWQAAPESFRREFQSYHNSYYDYEPILNGEEPGAWVEQRERELARPYQHYVTMDDAYGAYSPLKLAQVLQDSPAAFHYMMSDPVFRENFRAAQQGRLAGLYGGVLRQYNYNPALLQAIPDDGTRYLLSLMDPNAAAAFERYKIQVTKTDQPIIPPFQSIAEKLWGKGATFTIEPIPDKPGSFRLRRTSAIDTSALTGAAAEFASVQEFTVSAAQLAEEYAKLLQMQTEDSRFKEIKQQFERNAAIVQGLQLIYQGIQIGQRGGTVFEQLPAYYQAAVTAAQAGLFTGPVATFLLGPTGLLVGGILGILGGVFGAQRQAQTEAQARERAKKQRDAQEREQAIARAAQLRQRIAELSQQQIEQLAGKQVREFMERPSAITRQALFDALVVPRPSW